jgi:hypothetical protein
MKYKCRYCHTTEKLADKHYCKVKRKSVIVSDNHNWVALENLGKRLLSWALKLKDKNE